MRTALLAATLVLTGATEESAEMIKCAPPSVKPRAAMVEMLGKRYGESREWAHKVSDKVVLELFTNPTRGTWTIIVTTYQGMSCMHRAGTYDPPRRERAL